METITFCAFCGKEIKYDQELFAASKTGELFAMTAGKWKRM